MRLRQVRRLRLAGRRIERVGSRLAWGWREIVQFGCDEGKRFYFCFLEAHLPISDGGRSIDMFDGSRAPASTQNEIATLLSPHGARGEKSCRRPQHAKHQIPKLIWSVDRFTLWCLRVAAATIGPAPA